MGGAQSTSSNCFTFLNSASNRTLPHISDDMVDCIIKGRIIVIMNKIMKINVILIILNASNLCFFYLCEHHSWGGKIYGHTKTYPY